MKVVLAEKPSVARDIAKVLGATQTKDGYMEGNGWQVTWAFGHLVGLCDTEVYLNEEQKARFLTDKGKVRWTYDIFPIIPNSVDDFKYEAVYVVEFKEIKYFGLLTAQNLFDTDMAVVATIAA